MPNTTNEIEPTELPPQPEAVAVPEPLIAADALAATELPSPDTAPVLAGQDQGAPVDFTSTEAVPAAAPPEAPQPVDTAPTHIESGPFSTEGTYHGDPARFRGDADEDVALVQVLGTGITQVTYIDGPAASSESPKP